MFTIRSVLFCLAVAGVLFTTSGQDKKQQALDYLKLADEMKAGSQADNDIREVLVMAADLDQDNLRANFLAGRYHLMTVNKDLAAQYFLRVYQRDPNYRFDTEFWIGQSYQYGLDFDKAIQYYNLYIQRLESKPNYMGQDKIDRETVERSIYECQNGKEFIANPLNYAIVNMGAQINSEWDDYAPVLNEAEDEIIFTSRRRDGNLNENVFEDNKPWEDIFFSKKVNGAWQPAKNIGTKINSVYHDSNLALSADGSTLFLHKDENGGDIYFSKRQSDGTWGAPVPLPGMVNSSFAEKGISISRDQQTIYFSSNRPGGFGNLDIYSATVNSAGQWINVKNLGPNVNTPYDDDGPFIDYEGKILYFSSKGHKGLGGFDIYRSFYDETTNEWSPAENMGYPINTPDNDVYFVITKDGKRGYYSSIRPDGLGYDDIYVVTIPEIRPAVASTKPDTDTKTTPLKYVVNVVDGATKDPIAARVSLQGMTDNIPVASSPGGTGVFEFSIQSPTAKDYRLTVENEGYMFITQNVRLDGASEQARTVSRTIELRRLQSDMTTILRNIYFDFDKATFKQESYVELNNLERVMKQNPAMRVEIAGHTDNFGTLEYNMTLSQRRAEAVKDFLTGKGIDPRRIVAVGYGKGRPLVSNDDEEGGREINRRVEFKVISN